MRNETSGFVGDFKREYLLSGVHSKPKMRHTFCMIAPVFMDGLKHSKRAKVYAVNTSLIGQVELAEWEILETSAAPSYSEEAAI
ncbi:MAG: hypothetical protein LBD22_00325 [Spirochaetaceae bacterium]|jgi:hypothetical protein|nr:hypothetical protein [Spirochaetaceae bacterium]